MPYKCCIPRCRGNYKGSEKVSTFSFPLANEELLQKWIAAIPRKDFIPNKYSKVCEKHFSSDDIKRTSEFYVGETGKKIISDLQQPRLKENAVPSLFPGCPKYLSTVKCSREHPNDKKRRLENEQVETALANSLQTINEEKLKYEFNSLSELSHKLNVIKLPECYNVIQNEKHIMFLKIDLENAPVILSSVVVDENLVISAYNRNVLICKIANKDDENIILPARVDNLLKLNNILCKVAEFISESDKCYQENIIYMSQNIISKLSDYVPVNKKETVTFISEQLTLLFSKKNHNRYSSDFLILCSLVHAISPHAYRFLRSSRYIILPHPSTLQRLCSSYNIDPKVELSDNFLYYASYKFNYLKSNDKNVTLMIDEIHIKPFLDYKGGNILGMSYNCDKAANSAYVFMIQSFKSKFKDVVHILPVRTITAPILYEIALKVIIGLENIGYLVCAIITDNNSINRKAISLFSSPPQLTFVYPHPMDSSRPLFYLIDPVHLIKCIRNNWINQKNENKCMFYPEFEKANDKSLKLKTASFTSLRKLYEKETANSDIVKYAYTLTAKALFPNNMERQNVKLALQVFNLNTIEGLNIIGEKENILDSIGTANYIKIFCSWWDIMNVKTVMKGFHKLNVYQYPLTIEDSNQSLIFLDKFLTWLDIWDNYPSDTGRLSKETMLALKQTTRGIIEIARYCIEELDLNYILTGKFQTDVLEDRFGYYRQLSGSHYNITMTQLYENEKKLRLQSILPLSLSSHVHGKISVEFDSINEEVINLNEINVGFKVNSFTHNIHVTQDDLEKINDIAPALVYIGGYCVHSVVKNLNCLSCKNYLESDQEINFQPQNYILIQNLDRGGLKYPCEEVISIIMYNYIVITKLLSPEYENLFLEGNNQRSIACKITLNALFSSEIHLPFENCSKGHVSENIMKVIITKATNIFLKNYCKSKNDSIVLKKQTKRRKLETLSNPKS